jgi:hypothetical protein
MVKIPVPTRGVMVEVNTDEDCIRNVMMAPTVMTIYLGKA